MKIIPGQISTEYQEGFEHSLKNGKRLTLYATSYAIVDDNQPVIIYHLDDDQKNEYVAIHTLKSVELLVADYMKAKAKLQFRGNL